MIFQSTSEDGLEGELMSIHSEAGVTVKNMNGRNVTGNFSGALVVRIAIQQGETGDITPVFEDVECLCNTGVTYEFYDPKRGVQYILGIDMKENANSI